MNTSRSLFLSLETFSKLLSENNSFESNFKPSVNVWNEQFRTIVHLLWYLPTSFSKRSNRNQIKTNKKLGSINLNRIWTVGSTATGKDFYFSLSQSYVLTIQTESAHLHGFACFFLVCYTRNETIIIVAALFFGSKRKVILYFSLFCWLKFFEFNIQ
jgi:hypothetical protein